MVVENGSRKLEARIVTNQQGRYPKIVDVTPRYWSSYKIIEVFQYMYPSASEQAVGNVFNIPWLLGISDFQE